MTSTSTSRLDLAATPEELDELLGSIHSPVKVGLDRVKANLLSLDGTPPPFLSELLEHVVQPTGKRLRPALTLLASKLHPHDGRNAEIMAAAVELLHIASMVHDDTVDNSYIRRGKATVNRVWGRNAAVLVGDYVFATSATFVCDTGNIRVIRRFAETIMDLSAGELNEIASAYSLSQTREDYFQRIYQKTASLFSTATEAGAVLSGAPEKTAEAMERYGRNVGLAFQVVDDILDFDGSGDEIGKPVGSDLAQGIMTLPIIIAVERHGPDSPIARFLASTGSDGETEEAVAAVQDPAIIAECYEIAARYCDEAIESLASIESNPARDALEDVVSYVLRRRS